MMDSLKALTPPPITVQLHRAPEKLTEGESMEYTLWLAEGETETEDMVEVDIG